ncbi:ankyrin repeat domain-containing protein, partial [Vibrio cholerae]|uniref:ankyrin repeat domain-containing protein n=1 Tax=Vibrio cholerae TaxID=666 RepID=UPI0018F0E89F
QFAFNEDIDAPDKKHGETPLIWAIANDRFENVEILVVRGANINFVSKNGITILKAAQEHASSAMIKKVNEILTSHQMLSR